MSPAAGAARAAGQPARPAGSWPPPHRRAVRRPTVPVVALLLTALFLLVAGCARIATDGPVVAGDSGPEEHPRVRALVPPPAPGADPETIVTGFLGAGISPVGDYAGSRPYLTGAFDRRWVPGRQTLVSTGSTSVKARTTGADLATVEVTVTVLYRIDGTGHLTVSEPPAEEHYVLEVVMDAGQWRINDAPDLTVLTEPDFTFVFEPYTVYFLDPTHTFLIPEPRWLPDGESTASRLVDLVLAGPPQWLSEAAVSAFPAGTTRAATVEVAAGPEVIEVALSEQIAQSDDAGRGLMRAQLLATLQQVSGATDLRLTVDGRTMDAEEVTVRALPGTSETPVLLVGDRLALFEDGTLQRIRGLPALTALHASDPAIDYSGLRFAVLVEDHTKLRLLRVNQGRGFDAVAGKNLTPPSFDWRGWVWTADADGVVSAVSPDGVAGDVDAQVLTGQVPLALRIAPDGARAAVLTRDGAGVARVEVFAVERDRDGRPVRLTAGPDARVEPTLVNGTDLTWAGGLDLVVLGRRSGDSQERPIRVQLWGPPGTAVGRIANGRRVTAASTLRSTLIATGSVGVVTQAGAGWVDVPSLARATDPAYPG